MARPSDDPTTSTPPPSSLLTSSSTSSTSTSSSPPASSSSGASSPSSNSAYPVEQQQSKNNNKKKPPITHSNSDLLCWEPHPNRPAVYNWLSQRWYHITLHNGLYMLEPTERFALNAAGFLLAILATLYLWSFGRGVMDGLVSAATASTSTASTAGAGALLHSSSAVAAEAAMRVAKATDSLLHSLPVTGGGLAGGAVGGGLATGIAAAGGIPPAVVAESLETPSAFFAAAATTNTEEL